MIKKYDLIIKGGILVDPAQEIHNSKDIALVTGKVAEITDHIPEDQGRCVVDVSGRFVTPGLIDLHTHLFKGISNLGVDSIHIASNEESRLQWTLATPVV